MVQEDGPCFSQVTHNWEHCWCPKDVLPKNKSLVDIP